MLDDEITKSQRLVRTDAYQMSIGEVVNMYKDDELQIDPEFQRLFRWESVQKSRLIESILLGIPLPPIFVFEAENTKWELIDGLQRISTILEFMGLLKDPATGVAIPSSLQATKYLPSLNNVVWEKNDLIEDLPLDQQIPLDKAYQLAIRRARIGVEILKRPSDNNTKFDLFQRLNAAGTPANAQELRNCVIIMINGDYHRTLKDLANFVDFRTVVPVSEEQADRQKYLEYVCRFLTHTYVNYDGKLDVEEYIDEGMIELAQIGETADASHRFKTTFTYLSELYGPNALRRDMDKSQKFGLAAFESIAVGIARNLEAIQKLPNPKEFIEDRISGFWKSPEIEKFFVVAGQRGTTRIQRTVPFGSNWFKP
ncbi:DUF262 domain-containing protein [Massilia arenae]|uniref:DUF262 domain-containing protein n=1 Tax=Massilia arenae TaxID=2603288 RepID=A0A5C7G3H7_9BURK|nr:DUF262 domain-containing protein [Massilia arenae]TXF97427.1 DUF262 domain-containing protein [Massilia arenae]